MAMPMSSRWAGHPSMRDATASPDKNFKACVPTEWLAGEPIITADWIWACARSRPSRRTLHAETRMERGHATHPDRHELGLPSVVGPHDDLDKIDRLDAGFHVPCALCGTVLRSALPSASHSKVSESLLLTDGQRGAAAAIALSILRIGLEIVDRVG
jgi:hypothetical protein